MIHYFSPQPEVTDIPPALPDPQQHPPHPLAMRASQHLMHMLQQDAALSETLFTPANGKMFGVLVVRDEDQRYGYLCAYSGQLNQQWLTAGFVPPVFDPEQRQRFLMAGEARLGQLTQHIEQLKCSPARAEAQQLLSALEQQQVNALQQLKNRHQQNKAERHQRRIQAQPAENNPQELQQLSLLSQHDKREWKQQKQLWSEKIKQAHEQFRQLFESQIEALLEQRKRLSQSLHRQVFADYQLHSFDDRRIAMTQLFDNKVPPGGAGDCAAPKLLQYARQQHLIPIALAEFWWGAEPQTEVRHHGYFYPPCRGRCEVILPFMLQGLALESEGSSRSMDYPEPEIVYQDAALLVLNKPAGMLSIPGKQAGNSVLSWVQQQFPQASGPLLVHRLDMATSGLLLIAKNAAAHKHLQQQFIRRTVKKRYVAVLSRVIDGRDRRIELPLRVDLDDRPRQTVCYQYGKPAITDVRLISTDGQTSRVYFYPLSGRTHQLRVHAAHALGLAAPIVGDVLYGAAQERLLLHAERLVFEHPTTGEILKVVSAVPF